MATTSQTIDYLLEQLAGLTSVTARKMFGEYALYYDGKVVALVCDDELFVKPTTAGSELLQQVVEKPPYPGAKNYFWISGELWEDTEWLGELITKTAQELPVLRKKKPPSTLPK